MEKHASLVAGLAGEIADGNEGDQDTYREVSDIYSQEIDRLQKNKQTHLFSEEDIKHYRDTARAWRRKLQGATEAGHSHADPEAEGDPLGERKYLPHGLTEAEKEDKHVRELLSRCIKQTEISCCGGATKDYSECECNPVAVCRASVEK